VVILVHASCPGHRDCWMTRVVYLTITCMYTFSAGVSVRRCLLMIVYCTSPISKVSVHACVYSSCNCVAAPPLRKQQKRLAVGYKLQVRDSSRHTREGHRQNMHEPMTIGGGSWRSPTILDHLDRTRRTSPEKGSLLAFCTYLSLPYLTSLYRHPASSLRRLCHIIHSRSSFSQT